MKDNDNGLLLKCPFPPERGHSRITISQGVRETLAMTEHTKTRIDDDRRSDDHENDRPQDELPNEREHCLNHRTEKSLDHLTI